MCLYDVVKEELTAGNGYLFLIKELMLRAIISKMEQEEEKAKRLKKE